MVVKVAKLGAADVIDQNADIEALKRSLKHGFQVVCRLLRGELAKVVKDDFGRNLVGLTKLLGDGVSLGLVSGNQDNVEALLCEFVTVLLANTV